MGLPSGEASDASARIHEALRAIEHLSGVTIAVKLGDAGAVLGQGEGWRALPAFPVEARDTTGCGDAFVAGFLLALARGAPLEVAGRLGNALGALTATRPGAAEALPSLPEARAFLAARGARAELAVLDDEAA
ncbi:MAG: PfkB family carbohydrate kinase [Minicystis sp.]